MCTPAMLLILSAAEEILGLAVRVERHRDWAIFWCPFHRDEDRAGKGAHPNFAVHPDEAMSEARTIVQRSPAWAYLKQRGVLPYTALVYGLGYGIPVPKVPGSNPLYPFEQIDV